MVLQLMHSLRYKPFSIEPRLSKAALRPSVEDSSHKVVHQALQYHPATKQSTTITITITIIDMMKW